MFMCCDLLESMYKQISWLIISNVIFCLLCWFHVSLSAEYVSLKVTIFFGREYKWHGCIYISRLYW